MIPELSSPPTQNEIEQMHALYRHGGQERKMAPHVVYPDAECPHPGCGHHLRGIDFRLEDYGQLIHDALVRAWWNDSGFAGRCPACHGWIHFRIRGKVAINDEEATALPKLPDDWHTKATII